MVNPKHVLESSLYITSSPEIDNDLLDKEALDEEILVAARAGEGYASHVWQKHI